MQISFSSSSLSFKNITTLSKRLLIFGFLWNFLFSFSYPSLPQVLSKLKQTHEANDELKMETTHVRDSQAQESRISHALLPSSVPSESMEKILLYSWTANAHSKRAETELTLRRWPYFWEKRHFAILWFIQGLYWEPVLGIFISIQRESGDQRDLFSPHLYLHSNKDAPMPYGHFDLIPVLLWPKVSQGV